MNGFRQPNKTINGRRQTRQIRYYQYNRYKRLPYSVDWRENGVVTPVRNQGQCGSCYAFSAAGALEAFYKMRTGKLLNLSPQNIVDCTQEFGNFGCDGGYMVPAFYYATKVGIASEWTYPYVGIEQRCKSRTNIAIVKDNGFSEIEPGDELALKHAVAEQGPVVVAISASKRSFRFYKNGVYYDPNWGEIDHAVLVVGYGTHQTYGDYWIVKNSWGTGWGDNGYFYMARNRGNMCGISSVASFPV
uniref:Cathepsin L-like n=1 Tax=Loa loa TaxID=7209 RepID=A0A1I7VBE2_LOALO